MPSAATRQLLRRHAVAFGVALVCLTTLLLANYVTKRLPELRARGMPVGTIIEFFLLAVPFTASMTVPMAVLVAVLWVFTRLGADGTLAAARREHDGVRRLLIPVLVASTVVGALMLVWNAEILPPANARLADLQSGAHERGDREMKIGELRAEARRARVGGGPDAAAHAGRYELEIQKKYAIAATCVVFALTGAAMALLFPRAGVVLVLGGSQIVFAVVYVGLIAGESVADRMFVSPFVAMWAANALLLAFALPVVWWNLRSRALVGAESSATGLAPVEEPDLMARWALRVASALCAAAGLVGLGSMVALSRMLDEIAPRTWVLLTINALLSLLACIAAVWVWQRRRRGLVAAVLAWLLPMLVNLIAVGSLGGPSVFMVIALILLASSRHELH